MTDHAKVIVDELSRGRAAIRECVLLRKECDLLRAENARLRELGRELRHLLACDDNPSVITTPGCDCDSCNAARAWDEEVGK